MKLVLVIAVALIFTGCGAVKQAAQAPIAVNMSASNVFPLTPGQQWDMRDAAGQLTHFSVSTFGPEGGCKMGTFVNLHISKTNEEAYWHPGTPRIEITDWVLQSDKGAWKFASFFIFDKTTGLTSTWQPITGNVWQIIPDGTSQVVTTLTWNVAHNVDLRICMTQDQVQDVGQPEEYIVTQDQEIVNTPVYSGPVVASDFCEVDLPAPTSDLTPSATLCNRAHEKWSYAPGIGVVQIEIMSSTNIGPNSDGVTGYVTKRIN